MTPFHLGRSVPPRGLQIDPVAAAVRIERETATPLHPVLQLLLVAGFLLPLALGMCAIAVIPNFEARRDRARLDLANLVSATKLFVARRDRLPIAITELVEAGLIEIVPRDPWGRPYRYWIVRDQPFFVSLGRDGRCGGEGEDADIGSGEFQVHREECEARDR
jgi:hypothetical protein